MLRWAKYEKEQGKAPDFTIFFHNLKGFQGCNDNEQPLQAKFESNRPHGHRNKDAAFQAQVVNF